MARRALLLALGFVALKFISAHFVFPPLSGSVLWLPAGLSLAFLLRSPPRMWPALLAAVFAVEVGTVVMEGQTVSLAVTWGVGNVLRTLLGAALIRRFVGGPVLFHRVREVAGLLILGALVGTLPSATLGAGAAALELGMTSFRDEWLSWWFSDSLGTVLVTPMVLTWWPQGRRPREEGRGLLELAGLLAVVAVAGILIFRPSVEDSEVVFATLPYAAFPFVLAVALRHGPRGAASASAVMGVVAVEYTRLGHGPFGMLRVPVAEQVLSVQVFLVTLSLSALTLAALVAERRRAETAQRVLASAGAVLAGSPDWGATLPRVVRLIVPELCAGAAIWVVDFKGVVERVAAVGWTPEREAAPRGQLLPLPREPRHWRGPRGSGVLVPLWLRGQVVGALAMVADAEEVPLGRRDVLLAEDLARRCAMALENARLLEEAHEAISKRDEFITVAAHELRTPLTTLTLRLQSMMGALRRAGQGAAFLEKLGIISRQVTRLTGLVEGVLDVGQADTGELELRCEQVDLTALVEDVVEHFRGEAARLGCELRVRVAPHVTGRMDRARVELALGHLLGNALKFGIGAPVEVELVQVDGRARLTVRDHGIGIPSEALERIFGRFERAVSSLQYGGLGLGLFLTRQIAEAHGGSVHVTSEPGAGATFVLELPVEPRQSLEAPPSQPQPGV